MKRALVIGGTGFVGLAVVDALLEAGLQVRATRRRSSFTVLLRKKPVELVDACLEEGSGLRVAMRDCDVAVVAAGHYPRYSLHRASSIATAEQQARTVCRAALEAGVRRLVFTSSTGLLDPAPADRPADERDVPRQMPQDSVYRAVKWVMEHELELARAQGLEAVTLLPGGCMGPGDVRVGTTAFLVGVARGEMPWWVDGLVHMVDVQDVARAHVAVALHESPAPRYCLSGHPIRVGALLRRVVERYGGRMPPERLNAAQARERADREEREAAPKRARAPVPRSMVDLVTSGQPIRSALAEQHLGFQPSPLDPALDRAHAWFVRNGYLQSARRAAQEEA